MTSPEAFDGGSASNGRSHSAVTHAQPSQCLNNVLFALLFVPASTAMVLGAVQSLQWRAWSDPGFFAYIAWLMDHWHFVPYVDFFDINMPGIYYVHVFIGRVLGYEALSIRIADLACLGCLLVLTVVLMREFGRRTAFFSSAAFGVYYISNYPLATFALERDYLLLIPMGTATLILWTRGPLSEPIKGLLVSLLVGLCATVRLYALVTLPLFLSFQLAQLSASSRAEHPSFWSLPGIRKTLFLTSFYAMGAGVPMVLLLLTLWKDGALSSFMDVARNYWPLYANLAADPSGFYVLEGVSQRLKWAYKAYFTFGGATLLMVPGALGTFIALCASQLDGSMKRKVFLLWALAGVFSLTPLASAMPFFYRWIPFEYFACLLSGLCLIPQHRGVGKLRVLFPAVILFFCLLPANTSTLYRVWQYGVTGSGLPGPAEGRIDQIADYLRDHARPADTVQALDWIEGLVLPAMHYTRMKPATPFLYDLMFYHHTLHPYVIGLRERFLMEMEKAQPRFVIETSPPKFSGPGTTREFPQLRLFIEANYAPVLSGSEFTIYERRPGGPALGQSRRPE